MALTPYTLEQAEIDIAALRGQVDKLTEVLALNDSSQDLNVPSSGLNLYSLLGQGKYVSSADANDFFIGKTFAYKTGAQTISSTTSTALTDLAIPVSANKYMFEAIIYWTQGATAAAQVLTLVGPALTSCRVSAIFFDPETTGQSTFGGIFDNALGNVSSGAYAAGREIASWFKGPVNFSAAGTFQINAHEGTSGDPFTVNTNSWMTLEPSL